MRRNRGLRSKVPIEMSTVLVVKNRCQFCYAYFKDPQRIAEHSVQCKFRFSETFEAFDGKVKFACAVCFDVFQRRTDRRKHESLHKFPGGFPCSICDEIFLNGLECDQHTENVHKIFTTGKHGGKHDCACYDCGACFEQESYLRLHNETNCGRHRSWSCIECNLLTENAYKAHMEIQHKCETDVDDVFVLPKVEVTLHEGENMRPIEDIAKMNIIRVETSTGDPLYSEVKQETGGGAPGGEIQQILLDDYPDGIEYFHADDNSNENKPNVALVSSDDSIDDDDNWKNDKIIRKRKIRASEKKFACEYCGKKYFAQNRLKKHFVVHGPDFSLVHKCDLCATHFKTTAERAAHRMDAHKERLTCKICDKYFRTLKTLESHNTVHHRRSDSRKTNTRGTKIGKRVKCGESFVDQKSSDTHSQLDHAHSLIDGNGDDHITELATGANSIERTFQMSISSDDENDRTGDSMGDIIPKKRKNLLKHEKEFSCPHCGRTYSSKSGLDKHVIEHGPDRTLVHKCELCPIYFKTVDARDEHQITVHKEKLTCKVCNKLFRKYNSLFGHLRSHERRGPRKQYVCVKCGIKFSSKTGFDGHELSDCGRSPYYECDVCGKSLSNKNTLNRHMMIHTNQRKYQCEICNKKFRDKLHLTTHTGYIHSGERPHQCPYCEKRFVDLSTMKVHTITHTGIKRYICYGCGQRYPTNSALHKHRKYRPDTCALVPIRPLEKTDFKI